MSYVYMVIADMASMPMMANPDYGFVFFKVGISDNPWARCSGFQTSCPMTISVEEVWKFGDRETARAIERTFHEEHNIRAVRGEWFCDDPQGAVEALRSTICSYAFDTLRLSGEALTKFLMGTGMDAEYVHNLILADLGEEALR